MLLKKVTRFSFFAKLIILFGVLMTPTCLYAQNNDPEQSQNNKDQEAAVTTKEKTDEAKTNEEQTDEDQTTPVTPLGPATSYHFTQAKQNILLAQDLQTGEAVWLTALDQPFLATWHAEHSGAPKGAVLIMPNINTNPSQKHTLANLHHYLSANGWATLAISLPQQNKILPPARPAPISTPQPKPANKDNKDNQEQNDLEKKDSELSEAPSKDEKNIIYDETDKQITDDKMNQNNAAENSLTNTDNTTIAKPEPPQPTEPLALARISAAINYLQEQSQYNNVIVAEGIGAARAIDFLQTLATEPGLINAAPADINIQYPLRALVIINAKHSLNERPDLDIPQGLATLPIPILDIHTRRFHQNSPNAKKQLAMRKKAIATSQVPVYVDRTLESASVDQKGEHRLTRVIRGFLYQHAQGTKDTR